MDSNLESLANRLNSLAYVPQKYHNTDGNDSDLDLTALADIKLTETPKPQQKQRAKSMFKLDLGKLNVKQKQEEKYRRRRETSLGKLNAIAQMISPSNSKNGQKKTFHKRTRSLNYLGKHKDQIDVLDDKSGQKGKYISLQQKVARGVLAPLKLNENPRLAQKKTSLPAVLTKPKTQQIENIATLLIKKRSPQNSRSPEDRRTSKKSRSPQNSRSPDDRRTSKKSRSPENRIRSANSRSPIYKKQIQSGMTENGGFELKRKNPKRLYMKIR